MICSFGDCISGKKEVIIYFVILILIVNCFSVYGLQIIKITKVDDQILEEYDSPLFHPTYTKETFMVPMRDGVHLATDVYLPNEIAAPHGSILIRTPYGKNGINMDSWADQGWPVIVQDMRGRFDSEGVDTVFRNDNTDGPDTLAWIAQQNWSNGKIATYGGSALGINQYFTAGSNPSNLACQYIQVATPNLFTHAMFHGGEFRKNLVEEWLRGQGSLFVLPDILQHENYSLDYWTNTSLDDNWQDVNIPAIHIGGWYDCFDQGIIDGFMGYQYLGGSGARGVSKIIMGPWTHGASRTSGQLVYPENAMPSFPFELFVAMITKYTMGQDTQYDQWPAVSYYVMTDVDDIDAPGNEWRYADSWPIPSEEVWWYFHGDGSLSQITSNDEHPLTYSYDPINPVPTIGGQNLNLPKGPYDQRSIEEREDVLVFTSEVFTEPYEATGQIKAKLFVSSNCPDTDFTVKLSDVYPDGRSMLITDGILRMRNRNGVDHWEFIEPGDIYEIEVDMWSTSYIWNTGHKIRVAVSSSNYPRFLTNPNTEDAIYANTTFHIAQNSLYTDIIHTSCLILPEIKHAPSNPPNKPATPIGETHGKFGVEYQYTSNAIDPDTDQVSLLFDWGDGSSSGWIGPYNSGEDVTIAHIYSGFSEKSFEIKVKAKDIYGKIGEWSDPLPVTMPFEYKSILNLWDVLFERFLHAFLLLRQLME